MDKADEMRIKSTKNILVEKERDINECYDRIIGKINYMAENCNNYLEINIKDLCDIDYDLLCNETILTYVLDKLVRDGFYVKYNTVFTTIYLSW